MGDLEPSSIQAGSGEQFKRKKSISVGGPLFQKQAFLEHQDEGRFGISKTMRIEIPTFPSTSLAVGSLSDLHSIVVR
jgi:hypothetical protein